MLDEIIDRQLQDDGFSILHIPKCGCIPEISLTLGLSREPGFTEFVIVGHSSTKAHGILQSAAKSIMHGVGFTPNTKYDRHPDLGCAMMTYDLPGHWFLPVFGMNRRYLYGDNGPVMVLALPDENGRYPGEPDYQPVAGVSQVDLRDSSPPTLYYDDSQDRSNSDVDWGI